MGPQVPRTGGNIREKIFIDLVSEIVWNSKKELLFVDNAQPIHKICQCLSDLQLG